MTVAIGPSVADVARALAAAKQAGQSSSATTSTQSAAASGPTGRTGNEGDSVTLSETAQKIVTLRDGTEVTPIPLSSLRLITPQGLREDAQAGLRQIMAGLGIEGDLEFSISVTDDGAIAVESSDPHAADLEAAINADPALQKTLREMKMFSAHALEMPIMKKVIDWHREQEDQPAPRGLRDAVETMRDRIGGAHYTVSMTGGVLATAFVDAADESFGGVDTETGLDGRWT